MEQENESVHDRPGKRRVSCPPCVGHRGHLRTTSSVTE